MFLLHLNTLNKLTIEYGWYIALVPSTCELLIYRTDNFKDPIRFEPKYLEYSQGRYSYCNTWSENTVMFCGWMNYELVQFNEFKDKITMKEIFHELGFLTPDYSLNFSTKFHKDFLIKPRVGSFSEEIAGPYFAETVVEHTVLSEKGTNNSLFCEEFICGKLIKCWFWADNLVASQQVAMPYVVGNGRLQIKDLIEKDYSYQYLDFKHIEDVLNYFGDTLSTIPRLGDRKTFDFLYRTAGCYCSLQLYTKDPNVHMDDRNLALKTDLHYVDLDFTKFCQQVKEKLWPYLSQKIDHPFLYAIDMVVDKNNDFYVLELNTCPAIPIQAYTYVFKNIKSDINLCV